MPIGVQLCTGGDQGLIRYNCTPVLRNWGVFSNKMRMAPQMRRHLFDEGDIIRCYSSETVFTKEYSASAVISVVSTPVWAYSPSM